MPRSRLFGGLAAIAALLAAGAAGASELVYRPVNPNFGGNPLNGGFLLGTAQAQNSQDSRGSGFRRPTALEQFTETLQRRLLGDVARNISDLIFGPDALNFGEIAVQDTLITFERIGDQVAITIVDQLTGEQTQISLPVVN
jgi:hypothetical protein